MKKLIIEQLKEGFIFTDENSERYAVSSGSLSKRVQAYFRMTRPDNRERERIAPPVVAGKDARQCPETQGNMTADSPPTWATSQSLSTAQEREAQPPVTHSAKSKLGTPDNNLVQRGQCAEILEIPGFDSPAAPLILHPSDLKLAAFDYDNDKMQKYKSLEFLELPDGKVVLQYANSRYYTEREKVMQIPFPFLKGHFSKENGWSSSVEQAFKMYRRYLAETPDGDDGRSKAQKKSQAEINPEPQSSDSSASGVSHPDDPHGHPDGTCDDVSFDTCANNDPKTCKFCVNESRYEDKRKIAARKPGAPLLKASMGV